ncbi:hypothetical protein C8J57DRAFT_1483599, partial [Mycena rebaudengoi]
MATDSPLQCSQPECLPAALLISVSVASPAHRFALKKQQQRCTPLASDRAQHLTVLALGFVAPPSTSSWPPSSRMPRTSTCTRARPRRARPHPRHDASVIASTSARTKPSSVHAALMSLGPWEAAPAPLFWLRPRLLVSSRHPRRERPPAPLLPLSLVPHACAPRPHVASSSVRTQAHAHGGTRVNSGRRPLYFRVDSFLECVHLSLVSLGPWRSCAVAFVLGCGIGVLLVSYRAVPGRSSASRAEDHYYAGVSNEDEFLDAEEILVVRALYTSPARRTRSPTRLSLLRISKRPRAQLPAARGGPLLRRRAQRRRVPRRGGDLRRAPLYMFPVEKSEVVDAAVVIERMSVERSLAQHPLSLASAVSSYLLRARVFILATNPTCLFDYYDQPLLRLQLPATRSFRQSRHWSKCDELPNGKGQ